MTKKSKAQLEAENKMLKTAHWIGAVSKVTEKAIVWGSFAWIAYVAKEVLVAWAGKITTANINLRGDGSLTWGAPEATAGVATSDDLCLWLAIGGIAAGWIGGIIGIGQRQLRFRAVKHLAPEKIMDEQSVDSRRSSSGLLETGETRPEDL